ncbi:MAG: TolC family outer membrane protein [Geminicoccaceae bacterium]
MRRSTRLTAALVGAVLTGLSCNAWAETLKEALGEAYLTNPDLEAARARLRATDEQIPQATAGWRPRVFVDGVLEEEAGQIRRQDENKLRSANRSTQSAALTLQQNLYAGGQTVAQTARAHNLVRADRANLIAQEQSVLLDAVDAYTATARDQRVLDLALNNEQRLQRQLEATKDRFDVGEVARTDVAQAEARLARARADVETAKADLASSRAFYRRVIGKDAAKLEIPTTLKDLPKTLDDALAVAAANPEITAANYTLFAAKDDVDVAFADLLPSVDLQASLRDAVDPSATVNRNRTATIGVQVSIPLYQGGGEYARVRQNRQVVRQRREQLESSYRQVQQLVESNWERLLAATAAIESFNSEVEANGIALEGVQQEALVGSRTVLDVLDAEQELFTSQVNLVRARREEVLASYQLKAAVGELTVADLGVQVEPYNPDIYYENNRRRLFGIAID